MKRFGDGITALNGEVNDRNRAEQGVVYIHVI